MKKRDILIIIGATFIGATLSGLFLHFFIPILEPEKYTGEVSILNVPEITEFRENWVYGLRISAWAEPRDTYQIEIRWSYSYDHVYKYVIAGSKEVVLTSQIKNFLMGAKCPSDAPPELESTMAIVELLDPEKSVISHDEVWIRFTKQ